MKDSIEALIKLLKVNREKSPWIQELNLHTLSKEMIGEVKEFEEALDSEDKDHMKHELGDVFMDVLHLLLFCEEKELFTAKEVIDEVMIRLKRRKPFLVDGTTVTSIEEEKRLWQKAKEEEKAAKLKKEE